MDVKATPATSLLTKTGSHANESSVETQPIMTQKNWQRLVSACSTITGVGVLIAVSVERSFWCHSFKCEDFESLKGNREIANWTAFGLALGTFLLGAFSLAISCSSCSKPDNATSHPDRT